MNQVKIVDGTYAIVRDETVIGVVRRQNDTQWCFAPLFNGISTEVGSYVPLEGALKAGLAFQPSR